MQAGIAKRGTFEDNWLSGRIRFGTSVFHAYVHRWSCQLRWNPRINLGWGLSDGEGSERVWSGLSPLVAPLRYATPQHRVNAIDFRSSHANAQLRHEAVKHLRRKKTEARKRLAEAEATLRTLALPGEGCPGRDSAFFLAQWMVQRALQLDVIEETNQEKRDEIGMLLTLEEGLHVALDRLDILQSKRRQVQTQAERNELLALPGTVVNFEERIETIATELGGNEYQDMLGVNAKRTTAILAISVARAKMYEARVGVIEAQLRRHHSTGTRQQQHMVKVCSDRTNDLRNKYNTCSRRVQKYHTNYRRRPRVELPDFETVESMDVDDPFWNRGENEVQPGDEAEAERTRRGIDAYLVRRGAQDELCRIACETRHMMGWANEYHRRIMTLKTALGQVEDPTENTRLSALYKIVAERTCKLWKNWRNLNEEVDDTRQYLPGSIDIALQQGWSSVSTWVNEEWLKLKRPVIVEEPEPYENEEDRFYNQRYNMNGNEILRD